MNEPSPGAQAEEAANISTFQGGLGELIADAVQRYPQRVAFIDASGELTYAALGQRISQAIQTFDGLGLGADAVVAQLSGNRSEMFCVMAAAYLSGRCSVTLHAMASAADHAAMLADCRPSIFIGEHAYADRTQALRAASPELPNYFSHDDEGQDGSAHFWALAARYRPLPLRPRGRAEEIARLAYTGGTTGRAKGVMLSHRALLTNSLMWLAGLDWPDGVRCLCAAPISHGAGSLIYPTLVRGGCVVLQRGFEKNRWLAAVAERRIQHCFLVPTMLHDLLDHGPTALADLSSLRALVYGAAPMAPARIKQALALFGPVLVQSYGQTEAPNTILLLNQHDHACADRLASAGRPFPGITVALLDADMRQVPDGEIGEICVRGTLLMSGYLNQEAATAEAMAGGWLRTGDLARCDAEGYFYIVDRKKDMIISGGFNVYPKEVEDALMAHPDVQAVAVIGVPDPRWGEAVKAVVVSCPGSTPDAPALIEWVRQHKGAVHAPKSIDFVASLPLTGLGKADKKTLRVHYAASK